MMIFQRQVMKFIAHDLCWNSFHLSDYPETIIIFILTLTPDGLTACIAFRSGVFQVPSTCFPVCFACLEDVSKVCQFAQRHCSGHLIVEHLLQAHDLVLRILLPLIIPQIIGLAADTAYITGILNCHSQSNILQNVVNPVLV